MLAEMLGMATEWREPAISGRLPVHRRESPTGYSSAGCSPAEPVSASPVTDNSSSIPIRRGNQMRCSTALQGCSPALGYRLGGDNMRVNSGCRSPSPGLWLGCRVVRVMAAANRGVISTLRAG